jgi:hypothetical protein
MNMIRVIPAAILMLFAGSVYAHKGMHGPGAEFDADESGELSLTEYTAYLKSTGQDVAAAADKFAKLDRNKNGSLSSAELIATMPKTSAAGTP